MVLIHEAEAEIKEREGLSLQRTRRQSGQGSLKGIDLDVASWAGENEVKWMRLRWDEEGRKSGDFTLAPEFEGTRAE